MSWLEQLRRGTLKTLSGGQRFLPLPDLGRSPEQTGAQARRATSSPARDSPPARSFPYLPATAAPAFSRPRGPWPGFPGIVPLSIRPSRRQHGQQVPGALSALLWGEFGLKRRRSRTEAAGRPRSKGFPSTPGPRSTRAARKSAKGTRSLQDSDS